MKGLVALIIRSIGVKKLLAMVWEAADVELKKYVAASSNEYDDKALVVVEAFVGEFLKS